MLVAAGELHVVAGLEVDPEGRLDASGRFLHQCHIGSDGVLPFHDVVQKGVVHIEHLREFLLGDAAGLQLLLQHFSWMGGFKEKQVVRPIILCSAFPYPYR